jgi:hypothetical protein
VFEWYWCAREIGDKVSAITLRKPNRKWVCEWHRSKTEESVQVPVFLPAQKCLICRWKSGPSRFVCNVKFSGMRSLVKAVEKALFGH